MEDTYQFASFLKNMPDPKVGGGVDHLRSLAPGLSNALKLDTRLDEGISGSTIKVHRDHPAFYLIYPFANLSIFSGNFLANCGDHQFPDRMEMGSLVVSAGGLSRSTEITSLSWSSIQINAPPSL